MVALDMDRTLEETRRGLAGVRGGLLRFPKCPGGGGVRLVNLPLEIPRLEKHVAGFKWSVM